MLIGNRPDLYRVPGIGPADLMDDDHGAGHMIPVTQCQVILLDRFSLFHNDLPCT